MQLTRQDWSRTRQHGRERLMETHAYGDLECSPPALQEKRFGELGVRQVGVAMAEGHGRRLCALRAHTVLPKHEHSAVSRAQAAALASSRGSFGTCIGPGRRRPTIGRPSLAGPLADAVSYVGSTKSNELEIRPARDLTYSRTRPLSEFPRSGIPRRSRVPRWLTWIGRAHDWRHSDVCGLRARAAISHASFHRCNYGLRDITTRHELTGAHRVPIALLPAGP